MNSVNKSKFQLAANRLEKMGFGSVILLRQLSQESTVFIKKAPLEVAQLLMAKENSELCTLGEYESRFEQPPSLAITKTMQQHLINQKYVHPQYFTPQEKSH